MWYKRNHNICLLSIALLLSALIFQPIRKQFFLAKWKKSRKGQRKKKKYTDRGFEYNWGNVLIVQSIQFRCFELRFHCWHSDEITVAVFLQLRSFFFFCCETEYDYVLRVTVIRSICGLAKASRTQKKASEKK